MTDLSKFEGQPFHDVHNALLRLGFRIKSRSLDRKLNLQNVTYIRLKNGHSKVSVWHTWKDPDHTGVCSAGNVTDVDYTDLEVKEPGDE